MVRLPGEPGSPEFHTAYALLLTEIPKDIGRYTPGSVAHTIHLYYQSGNYTSLAEGSKRDYKRYLDRLDRSVGERPIASVDDAYVLRLADKMRATPSAANHAMAVLRTLFKFALKRKIIGKDPTVGVERHRGGEVYERWLADDLEAFRASASPMMRLSLELGVYTGQRLSDVIALRWTDYEGGRFRLRQQKTGARLSIPAHADLAALLAGTPKIGPTILTSKSGLQFHSRVFSRDFRDARIKAGLPDGLSFHGLRHTAAARLAEVGATGSEIRAITGHKSLKLVEHYISQADQELQADRAISLLPTAVK